MEGVASVHECALVTTKYLICWGGRLAKKTKKNCGKHGKTAPAHLPNMSSDDSNFARGVTQQGDVLGSLFYHRSRKAAVAHVELKTK